jgi:hypothetical protein
MSLSNIAQTSLSRAMEGKSLLTALQSKPREMMQPEPYGTAETSIGLYSLGQ